MPITALSTNVPVAVWFESLSLHPGIKKDPANRSSIPMVPAVVFALLFSMCMQLLSGRFDERIQHRAGNKETALPL
jgi:hypothetical protein